MINQHVLQRFPHRFGTGSIQIVCGLVNIEWLGPRTGPGPGALEKPTSSHSGSPPIGAFGRIGAPSVGNKLSKKIKVIDLRWLSDIDYPLLIKEISNCKKILIVDECRRKGSYGEGIFYELYKRINRKSKIKLHAAKNSFISLGESATVTLPSKNSIFNIAIKFINE